MKVSEVPVGFVHHGQLARLFRHRPWIFKHGSLSWNFAFPEPVGGKYLRYSSRVYRLRDVVRWMQRETDQCGWCHKTRKRWMAQRRWKMNRLDREGFCSQNCRRSAYRWQHKIYRAVKARKALWIEDRPSLRDRQEVEGKSCVFCGLPSEEWALWSSWTSTLGAVAIVPVSGKQSVFYACSPQCARKFETQIEKERLCLEKSRDLLKQVRRHLKSRHAASQSPSAASIPAATSCTSVQP